MLAKIEAFIKLLPKHWTSVMEKSISDLYVEAGLSSNDGAIVFAALKELGVAESTGNRSGVRYKLGSVEGIDTTNIAEKAMNIITLKKTETPTRKPNKVNLKENGVKPKYYTVFDEVYFIADDTVYKGIIQAVSIENNNKVSYGIKVEHKNTYIEVSKVFGTKELLLQYVNHILKSL